jgi:carboxylate-amine ligase
MLPRQGVPPAIASWESLAADLRWGRASGAVPEPRRWWFELRPHLAYGTLELRAPDTQATLAESTAVAAFAHALVGRLSERYDAGERLGCPDDWRIGHNRFAACRFGLDAELADLESGAVTPARELLRRRLEELAPVAARLGCAAELGSAGDLVARNGAERRRADGPDPVAVARGLADAYLPGA